MDIRLWIERIIVIALILACAAGGYFGGASLSKKTTYNTLAEIPKQYLLTEGDIVVRGSDWEKIIAYTAPDSPLRKNASEHFKNIRNITSSGTLPNQRLITYTGEVVKYDNNNAVVQAEYTLEEGSNGDTLQTTNRREFYLTRVNNAWLITDVAELWDPNAK